MLTLLTSLQLLGGCTSSSGPCDADSAGLCDSLSGELLIGSHPCTGYSTDALWMDSNLQGWLGCGTDAYGQGFWRTTDGGLSWSEAEDQSSGTGFLSSFRVNHSWRSPDTDLLYIAGISTLGSQRVVSLSREGELREVYNNGSLYDYSLTAGSYVRSSAGVEVVEALTGVQLLVRKAEADWQAPYLEHEGWANGYGWWEDRGAEAGSVLDMDAEGEAIVGCGNTTSTPPVVYLPPRGWDFGSDGDGDEDATVEQLWEVVTLSDPADPGQYGALWDIDADAGGLVAGGVNQVSGQGVIYSIGSDWPETGYDRESWSEYRVSELLGSSESTWVRGVCRSGDTVMAVGEYSRLGEGFILRSEDGGLSFEDLSPEVMSAGLSWIPGLQRCQLLSNGGWAVAGGSGAFISAQ